MIALAVFAALKGAAQPDKEVEHMRNSTKRNKAFAESEREQLRELFKVKTSNPPIPNPFDAVSMRKWDEYCEEMREIEEQLKAVGELL